MKRTSDRFGNRGVGVCAWLCALALMTAGPVGAADLVDNPLYASWARHPLGTAIEWRQDSELPGGNKSHAEVTATLVELTGEHAVIECRSVVEINGTKRPLPATRKEYPAKVERSRAADRPAGWPGVGGGVGGGRESSPEQVKKSAETLDVGGRKYACQVTESLVRSGEGETLGAVRTRVWECDEVPGRILRLEVSGEGAMRMSSKMEIVRITPAAAGDDKVTGKGEIRGGDDN